LQVTNLASPTRITQIQLSQLSIARFAGFPERDFFLFTTLGAGCFGMPGGIAIPGGICIPPLTVRICFMTF
jgi:hypothetical protein